VGIVKTYSQTSDKSEIQASSKASSFGRGVRDEEKKMLITSTPELERRLGQLSPDRRFDHREARHSSTTVAVRRK